MGGVGSDIAVDAADIVLVNDRVEELPHLLALSRMTTIRLNLAFSMALNLVAIVLAMTGVLNPVVGALVHNAGSVLVILNSALLLKWRRKRAPQGAWAYGKTEPPPDWGGGSVLSTVALYGALGRVGQIVALCTYTVLSKGAPFPDGGLGAGVSIAGESAHRAAVLGDDKTPPPASQRAARACPTSGR